MIAIELHEAGCILPIRAQPGSKKSELRGELDGSLKVAVTQVAEKGKANKAIIALLCKELRLRKSQIELVSGHTSTQKRLLIRDLAPNALRTLVDDKLQ